MYFDTISLTGTFTNECEVLLHMDTLGLQGLGASLKLFIPRRIVVSLVIV